MKRLITICAVVGLMLSLTCVSWASVTPVAPPPPQVFPPPDAPRWWNAQCIWYAYGWWEADLTPGSGGASPPSDGTHWASNYLSNGAFTAGVQGLNGPSTPLSINLGNVYHENLDKELYIYITGTTTSTEQDIVSTLDTDSGVFSGLWGGSVGGGNWTYTVSGVIHPQPENVHLTVTVPGLTSVTNIWAGENCVPEPATIALLGFGALSLLRSSRRRREP